MARPAALFERLTICLIAILNNKIHQPPIFFEIKMNGTGFSIPGVRIGECRIQRGFNTCGLLTINIFIRNAPRIFINAWVQRTRFFTTVWRKRRAACNARSHQHNQQAFFHSKSISRDKDKGIKSIATLCHVYYRLREQHRLYPLLPGGIRTLFCMDKQWPGDSGKMTSYRLRVSVLKMLR